MSLANITAASNSKGSTDCGTSGESQFFDVTKEVSI